MWTFVPAVMDLSAVDNWISGLLCCSGPLSIRKTSRSKSRSPRRQCNILSCRACKFHVSQKKLILTLYLAPSVPNDRSQNREITAVELACTGCSYKSSLIHSRKSPILGSLVLRVLDLYNRDLVTRLQSMIRRTCTGLSGFELMRYEFYDWLEYYVSEPAALYAFCFEDKHHSSVWILFYLIAFNYWPSRLDRYA